MCYRDLYLIQLFQRLQKEGFDKQQFGEYKLFDKICFEFRFCLIQLFIVVKM